MNMNNEWNEFLDWVDEQWRDIEGFEGLYQVSSLGRVRSMNYRHTKKEKILKPVNNKRGYLKVSLSKEGKIKQINRKEA